LKQQSRTRYGKHLQQLTPRRARRLRHRHDISIAHNRPTHLPRFRIDCAVNQSDVAARA
jgi:Holliday junction resolvase-like predicted endonuclease